ncbi:WXG100 family type VII secretion target [Nocardia sp. X0981]
MSGTDPEYISAMEHFESMRHEDIYAGTQQIDAAEILRASGTWMHAATTLQTSFPLTRSGAERVMSAMGWEGEAADAAYAGTRSFADSVNELAAVLGQVGLRLGAVAAAAEAVKIAVVPPGESGPVGALARLMEAAKVIDAHMVQEVLRQEAILTMNMVYKPAYTTAGTGVPALPDPPAAPGALPPLEPPRSQVVHTAGTVPAPAPTAPGTAEPGADAPRDESAPPSAPAPENAPQAPAPPAAAGGTPPPPVAPAPGEVPPPAEEPKLSAPPPPAGQPPAAEQPSAPPEPPAPETPPAPAPPAPAQPPEPPAPAPAEPEAPAPPGQNPTGVPLSDPGGQPGITGPVPGQRAPDQPGVIPPGR